MGQMQENTHMSDIISCTWLWINRFSMPIALRVAAVRHVFDLSSLEISLPEGTLKYEDVIAWLSTMKKRLSFEACKDFQFFIAPR